MPTGFKEAMATLPTAQIGDVYHTNSQKMINEVFVPVLDQLFRNKLTPEAAAQRMQDEAGALL